MCWRPYWILKKPMDEILHTVQKLSCYACINSYRSLKKSVLHFHLKCDFLPTSATFNENYIETSTRKIVRVVKSPGICFLIQHSNITRLHRITPMQPIMRQPLLCRDLRHIVAWAVVYRVGERQWLRARGQHSHLVLYNNGNYSRLTRNDKNAWMPRE